MASTYYGTWTPASASLPDVSDYDFAAFYILESGTYNGTEYTKDSWLIYICESRGTLSERSYWRTSDGIVLFNLDSHTNVPSAGFYTKVRLDNAGNIVAANDIEYDDLPTEAKNLLESCSDDHIADLIVEGFSTLFANNALNPVSLKFDTTSNKVSAALRLDETTLGVNEYGQLTCLSAPDGTGSTIDVELITSDIQAIKAELAEVQEKIVKITPIAGNGINITVTSGGSVISANIDENSIKFNENGQLCVNTDIIAEYIDPEGTGECANRKVSASDIEGLEELITQILGDVTITNILMSDLSQLIDEETIIINEYGKLTAIATGTAAHQHVMDDITDLNQDIANVWASNQKLHAENDNQDFTNGAIDMSTLTIGEILIAFNKLLKQQQEQIDALEKRDGSIEPTEPNLIDLAAFEDISEYIDAIDVNSLEITHVCKTVHIKTTDIIYQDGSDMYCYIDGVQVDSISCYDIENGNNIFTEGTRGNFIVTYKGDAYPTVKMFQGYYQGYSFEYVNSNLSEGEHTIQFKTVQFGTELTTWSQTITVRVYNDFEPECIVDIISQPDMSNFVSGVSCCNDTETNVVFQVKCKSFNKYYMPCQSIIATALNIDYDCNLEGFYGSYMYCKQVKIPIDDYTGTFNITSSIIDWNNNQANGKATTEYINIDRSTEEAYRYVQIAGNTLYNDSTSDISEFIKYDSSNALLDEYINEAQVIDSILTATQTDYKTIGIGPDYSVKSMSQQQCILRFDLNTTIENLDFDIYDEEGNSFTIQNNGTLYGIELYAGITNNEFIVNKWVDCNKPYKGYDNYSNYTNVWSGLDLFRSTPSHRWITLGYNGELQASYLFIKIVLLNGLRKLDLKKLISSIQGAINDRR